MAVQGKSRSYKFALGFKIVAVFGITFSYILIGASFRGLGRGPSDQQEGLTSYGGRHLLAAIDQENCTPAAIGEFPSDGFTREQRRHGWALLHAFLACYMFILLAIVCDDYFVPAVKSLCDGLNMREDIAGATFMATASSSPELFINCVGTFITEGDIGVGTIVGSAVFNILAVPACCGLFANMVLQLDWWPITRDSTMYSCAVVMLITFLQDERIELYEAAILVGAYVVYLTIMFFNEHIITMMTRLSRSWKKKRNFTQVLLETQPLLTNGNKNGVANLNGFSNGESMLKHFGELDESTDLWKWPREESKGKKCWWVLTWPISFLLYITTPDCRKCPKLTLLTFLMCMLWIGTVSYLSAWMITVLGDTLDIPDSVMGLTFLAAGTSVPEAVSSIIVTNQGHGGMGLSSSIGSNTFDILLCLGLPWLLKSSLYPKVPGENSIIINSSGITYSALSLLSMLLLFYLSLVINKFRLDWKIGLTCLLMYIVFLTMASLIELNVFFQVNLPTCSR